MSEAGLKFTFVNPKNTAAEVVHKNLMDANWTLIRCLQPAHLHLNGKVKSLTPLSQAALPIKMMNMYVNLNMRNHSVSTSCLRDTKYVSIMYSLNLII